MEFREILGCMQLQQIKPDPHPNPCIEINRQREVHLSPRKFDEFYIVLYLFVIYHKNVIIYIYKFAKSRIDKNNNVYDLKYIATYILNHRHYILPLDLRWQGQPKNARKGAYFHQGPPRGIRKNQLET